MTMPAEIQTYFDKMDTLMNECQKHIDARELDKAKEKNQKISDVLTEMIEWSQNNGVTKIKYQALKKCKRKHSPFLILLSNY